MENEINALRPEYDGMETVFRIQKSADRHHADYGWLKTAYCFSFAEYQDPENMNWGPLRVFNDDVISGKKGFGEHPHADMEILTYVLEGELEHQDSMKNKGIVRPGGVQYMSAGTGVVHAERNPSEKTLHLCQMWILPDRKFHKPSYGQVDFTEKDRLDTLLKVASGHSKAPIRINQDAELFVSKLERKRIDHTFHPGRLGFLFAAEGKITANGHALGTGDAVRIAGLERLELEGTGEIVLWDLGPWKN